MVKIWKISKVGTKKNLAFESKNIFINDFSIQKQRLMSSFLKGTHDQPPIDVQHLPLRNHISNEPKGNLFKVDPKEMLIEYSKIHELKLISIGLASPEKIQQWAEKILPNGKILGEITNANTLHYKTFKPTKGGLFCERIFGPLKDFECSCGIRQRPNQEESKQIFDHIQIKRKFCSICDVEYTWSVIRRYQLGYIRLISPVSHLWYLRANPSYLSILLDMKRKKLENIIYCSETTTLENNWKSSQSFGFENSPTFLYLSWQQTLENQDLALSQSQKTSTTFLVSLQGNSISEASGKFLSPSKKFDVKLSPKRVKSREKQLDSDLLKLPNWNSQEFQQKINSKLKKRLIPKIWSSLWKTLFRESYVTSVKQNAKIWRMLWSKYKIKFVLTFPTKLKTQSKNSQNQFKPVFQKNRSPKNLFLNSKNLDPYVQLFQTYEKHFFQTNQVLNVSLSQKKYVRSSIKPSFNLIWNVDDANQENETIFQNRIRYFQTIFMVFFVNWLQSNSNFSKMVALWDSGQNHQNQQDKLKHFSRQFIKFEQMQGSQSAQLLNLYLLYLTKNQLKNRLLLNHMSLRHFQFDSFAGVENFQLTKDTYRLLTKKSAPRLRLQFFSFLPIKLAFANQIGNVKPNLIKTNALSTLASAQRKSQWRKPKINSLERKSKILEHYYPMIQDCSNQIPNNASFDLDQVTKPLVGVSQLPFIHDKTKIQSEKSNFYVQRKTFQTRNRISNNQNWAQNSQYLLTAAKPLELSTLEFSPDSIGNVKGTERFDPRPMAKEPSALSASVKSLTQKVKLPEKYVNNIYCLSYAYSWDLERDWKYFFYAISAPLAFEDSAILCYTHRTPNLSEFLSGNFITGAGLIQQLLKEFQPTELKKMSKQHRILLPKIRQKIRKLKSNRIELGLGVSLNGNIPHPKTSQPTFPYKVLAKTQLSEIEKLLKKRDHIMKRFKILRKMLRKNTNPSSMVLSNLPVLPPDLRPILKLQDQIAASDLNTLYQRILFRNDRLKKFLKDPAISQSFEAKYAQRLLQEAVDNLIQNGKGNTKPETNSRGQPLKSLSEILKGKQGRFRQYLLGKRVDYSGRSVIVVGPKLQLHECGLPKEMAIELFLPFLIKKILHYRFAATILGAKTLIQKKEPMIWDLLREILRNHPVLLNRAPTLHRLGIQAFQPKLVEGRAILIHPLVCPAFNADFDGDQMAVHVPITIEARIEAWKLMFSGNNLISAATGEPIVLPSQDMVLGLYYLTAEKIVNNQIQQRKHVSENSNSSFYDFRAKNYISTQFLPTDYCFSSFQQVFQAYQLNLVHAHSLIWLKWNGNVETKSTLSIPHEIQVTKSGDFEEIRPNGYRRFNSQLKLIHQFVRTTPGRVFLNLRIQQYF